MKLTKVQQLAAGLAAILLAVLVAEFVIHKDKKNRIVTISSSNEELGKQIRDANRIKQNAAILQEEMKDLAEQLEKLKTILPVTISKPKFYKDIRRIANEEGIEIVNLSNNKPLVDDVIEEHPFTVITRGNYHDIGRFFAKMSRYQRIVNIKGVNLSQEKPGSGYALKAGFILSMFTYREPTKAELEAQLKARKEAKKGSKKKK